MTTLERFETRGDGRRAWRRVPVRVPIQCRRLGRRETDVVVETVDLSPGGVRLRAGGLITGDVVLCSMTGPDGDLGLKGLVVATRPGTGGPPWAHVAWTNLSPDAVEQLGRLLSAHEDGEQPA
ncbi:MAG TPA: PilZ domain-containing protein [Acidimicrobiales bacterium]|nr:PilZ domain-containing protein [Acidimicrobiales bacterium]